MGIQSWKALSMTLCLGATALGLTAVPLFAEKGIAEKGKTAALPASKKVEHAHPDEGPHGGSLIELGEEEYHAELILEEKKHLVIVYVLDSHAKEAVSVDSQDALVNLKHGGKPKQYKLTAYPEKLDPKGKTSRFRLEDHGLVHDLHHKDADARLRLKIAGKNYSGKISLDAHDHDHDHKPVTKPAKQPSK